MAPPAAWVTGDGSEADEKVITSMLSSLSNLKCESYIEGVKKEDLEDPVYTVIVKGLDNVTLSIFGEEEEKYPAVSSRNEYPFYLPRWKAEQLMKKPSDIIAKEGEQARP